MAIASRLLRGSVERYRRWRLQLSGAKIGRDAKLGSGVQCKRGVRNGQSGRIEIESTCTLSQGVVLDAWGGSITIAKNVFLGEYVVIYGHGGVEIGDDTLIAMHCRILSSNHTLPSAGTKIRDCPDVLLPTKIGRDVWLGAGVTVLGGVAIGDGCVVAAGAVVTKDMPPYSIAMGVPARVVRTRSL